MIWFLFFIIWIVVAKIIFGCQELRVTEMVTFPPTLPAEESDDDDNDDEYDYEYRRQRPMLLPPPPQEVLKLVQIVCSNMTSINQIFFPYQERLEEQHLIVENSNISTLTPSGFVIFTTITTLQLSQNYISVILPGAFNGLTRLKELYLDHNELSELSKGVYNSLHRLEVLNLANNKIHRVENLALSGVNNLIKLHLENNQLSKIEDGTFETLTRLKSLDLSGNSVEKLWLDTPLNLEILNMTGNALIQFDVDMSNLTMRLLNLSSNGLSTVNFALFPRVDRVDFSNNEIVSVQNCQNLDSIYVSLDNNKIKKVSGSFNAISKLFLAKNKLEILENGMFENSTEILTIDVSFNSISIIEKDVFEGLKSLTTLLLQNNGIASIDPSLFRDLTSLEFLSLSHNQIENFKFGTFDSLSSLQTLDISSNKLVDLQQYTLSSLTRLHHLNLDNNLISYFDVTGLKTHLSSLRTISLKNNSWNCQDLVKLIVYLRRFPPQIIVLKGDRYDVENFQGIACKNVKNFANFFNVSQFSLQNFSKQFQEAIDGGVRNSKMDRFFNDDFQESKFFRYFDKDYSQSNFFKYLDNYKFAAVQRQNSNDSKMEKLTSLQVSPTEYNDKILIFSAVIQVLIVFVLVGGFVFFFGFLKKLHFQQKPTLSSQMELC